MPPPTAPKIYHIVHVDRLSSIIDAGQLWSDAEIVRRAAANPGIAGKDPVFGHAAALDRDKECRRRALYEMIVEAKTRRGGDYGEHQAMPVNFPCRRRRRLTWFDGRIHPAHRFKVNDVKRETASWRVTVAISCTSRATQQHKRLEMRGLRNGYR